jgi:DNA-directed RNA polymerase subunit RPC12/RpoP
MESRAYILILFPMLISGCAFTQMNKSLHETYDEKPSAGSYAVTVPLDIITSPVQVVVYGAGYTSEFLDQKKELEWNGCPSCKSTNSSISIAPRNDEELMKITCSACGSKFQYSEKTGILEPLIKKTEPEP